ncbi:C39 family peptidase [Dactylosporangium sp. CA-152071]|uniref:C39 family peptidase n=1 Tax=Dactylosporangium sp. CA-152071 TaxID=3239933 RepID=UPI003D8DF730
MSSHVIARIDRPAPGYWRLVVNLESVQPQSHRAGDIRRPRMAVTMCVMLAAAAVAGIVLSQLGDPPSERTAAAGAALTTKPPKADGAAPSAPTTMLLKYQFQLQPNYYFCGPAATRIALTAAGHAVSQDEAAAMLGTTTNGTNSALDTTRVLNQVLGHGRTLYQTREIPVYPATPAQAAQLQTDVLTTVGGGRAIVANIAGHVTDTAGAVHAYEGGHYLTVVGYRDGGGTVKIADPADPSGDGTYWLRTPKLADWISSRGYSY